ncbi:hypothetical protein [Bradyrhizobium erythrophlei]|uniref:hypothetical protein n=1 Tax=Bradyrhizobium erythrophlei TaxID=1437360 RepID=UPI00406B9DE5
MPDLLRSSVADMKASTAPGGCLSGRGIYFRWENPNAGADRTGAPAKIDGHVPVSGLRHPKPERRPPHLAPKISVLAVSLIAVDIDGVHQPHIGGVVETVVCRMQGYAGDRKFRALQDRVRFLQARKLGLSVLTANVADFDVLQLLPTVRTLFYRRT